MTSPPVGTWDAALFARYRDAQSPPAKRVLANLLLRQNEPLIKTICSQMTGRGEDGENQRSKRATAATKFCCADFRALEWEDAYQGCMLGFLKALDGFNPEKGKFAFYFTFCARYQLQKIAAGGLHLIRTPHKKEAERPDVVVIDDQATLDRMGGDIAGNDLAGAEGLSSEDVAEFERRGHWPETVEEWHAYREAKTERDRAPIDVFFDRLKFSPSARCVTSQLFFAWERCLVELGACATKNSLRDALKARGVRNVFVRSYGDVYRGLRGVCLQR